MFDLSINSSNQNGLHLHLCNTNKFKTISIMLTIQIPLQENGLTARALLPNLLNGGSINYPNRKLLKRKLEELYGTTLSTGVLKKGGNQLLNFVMEIPDDRFLNTSESLLKSALCLLHEIIYNPGLENGIFNSEIVEQEKSALKQRLTLMNNDKMLYANLRLIEEMFNDELYRLSAQGYIEEIDSLDASSIYKAYKELLQSARFDLFIVGAFCKKETELMIKEIFLHEKFNSNYLNPVPFNNKTIKKVKLIEDNLNVNQGKLFLGYRTSSTIRDKDFEATRVANAIFGRFPSSKLFVNIREKEGLAYFALSQIESNLGILFVLAGIDFENYEYVVEIIKEQEDAMKKGLFTENEIEQAKAMLINQLMEAYDTPSGIIDILMQSVDSGLSNNLYDQIQKIKNVSKNDIIHAANKWALDTIYFLNRKKEVYNENYSLQRTRGNCLL